MPGSIVENIASLNTGSAPAAATVTAPPQSPVLRATPQPSTLKVPALTPPPPSSPNADSESSDQPQTAASPSLTAEAQSEGTNPPSSLGLNPLAAPFQPALNPRAPTFVPATDLPPSPSPSAPASHYYYDALAAQEAAQGDWRMWYANASGVDTLAHGDAVEAQRMEMRRVWNGGSGPGPGPEGPGEGNSAAMGGEVRGREDPGAFWRRRGFS